MRVKHMSFNPMWAGLQMILTNMEEDGWALSHVVPVTQYEAVAVFMKADDPKNEESEVEFTGEGGSYL